MTRQALTLLRKMATLDIGTIATWFPKAIRAVVGKWTAGKVVTLDVDRSVVRLMETRGGVIKKWASIIIPPTEVESAGASPPALGTIVRELMASSGIKARKVIASLSGLYSVNRILLVPNPAPGLTLKEAVLDVVRETTPLSEDRVYLSWQTIATSESGRQVLVVAVPREILDEEVQSLRAVRINPRLLELRAMALARAVNREQALILNIEPSSFDIVLVVNNIPEVMHPIAWQPDELPLIDKVENLATNLELTVDFYNSRHPDSPFDSTTPLFITGQMSADLPLVEKLKARLSYPIEPLSPPLQYSADFPVSQYAVNIGLALKRMSPARYERQGGYSVVDMNILPDIYRPWRPSAKQLYAFALILAAVALLFPFYQKTTEAMDKTAALEATFSLLNKKLEIQKLEIKKREPLEKAISEYHMIVNMGGNFTEDLSTINREAEKLGIQVNSIIHEGSSITVNCQANKDDYITFRKFLTALEKSGRFSIPIPPPEGYPYTWQGSIKLQPKPLE